MEDASQGRPRLVIVEGEAGIGKSRLAEEIVDQAAARGIPSTWGRAVETDGASPYWPWRQAIRSLIPIVDDETFAQLAPFQARELARIVPEIGSHLGLGTIPEAEGTEQRLTLFDTVTRFLQAVAIRAGLIVVLDDMQWADAPSLLLLVHVVKHLDGSRLLLVATHRLPEPNERFSSVLPELIHERPTEQLALRGLAEQVVGELLDDLFGGQVPPYITKRAYELTGGNPFFVQELSRALVEESTESMERAWLSLPTSVLAVIRRRLEALSVSTRELLRVASVAGRQFPVAVAAEMAGISVLDALSLIDEASASGLIEPADAPGEHRFTHALVRDAVEADLGGADRAQLHRAAAIAIENYFAGRLDPHLSDLARHWAEASPATGERAIASVWAERAGDAAMKTLAFEEAARLYRLALDVRSGMIGDVDRCRMLLSLGTALFSGAELRECFDVCLEAAALAREVARPDLIGEAALVMEAIGEPRWNLAIRDLCEEALAGLGEDQPALRARLLAQLSHASIYVGDITRVDLVSREAVELAESSGDPRSLASALQARHLACASPEGSEERATLAGRMLDVARALRSPWTEMWAHLWRAEVAFENGGLLTADAGMPALALCVEQIGQPLARWHLLRSQAGISQGLGRFADAKRFAEAALHSVEGRDHPVADAMHKAATTAICHHIGYGSTTLHHGDDPTATWGPFAIMSRLDRGLAFADAGRTKDAAVEWDLMGPPGTWKLPAFLRVLGHAMAILVAKQIDARENLETLYNLLLPDRRMHAVAGGGVVAYYGPAEMFLGMAAASIDRVDEAVEHLSAAVAIARGCGARGFVVEAQYELAWTLARRAAPSDLDRVRSLLDEITVEGHALGMAPFLDRTERLAAGLGLGLRAPSGAPSLTRREQEVAGLVARGMTNREIAEVLVVSERTAQNHVQHILTKLNFSTRAQIAVWAARGGGGVEGTRLTPGI